MKKRRFKIRQKTSETKEEAPEIKENVPEESEETPSEDRLPRQRYQQLNYGHYFMFFLLFLCMFSTYKLLEPYWNSIILATIMAILLHPVQRLLVKLCGNRRNLAAFLTCIILTLLVVLPLTFMLFTLIQQGVQAFNAISDWVAAEKYKTIVESQWVKKILTIIEEYLPDVQKFFPDFDLENIRLDQILLRTSSAIGQNLLKQGGQLLGNITSLAGKSFLMLFAFFFIVRDQEKMLAAFLHLIPLSSSHERQILDKIKSVAQSALLGTFATAIAQGVAGGIAFRIAHLPGFFWGTMMAFASLIPVIGTALIWVPAAIYLLLAGHWGYSIFMALWCAIIVGSIDNFVRPLFMKGAGGNMSTLVIFFSIMGGINLFGLIGLLYGPMIIGLTMVFLYIYSLEFKSFLSQQDKL